MTKQEHAARRAILRKVAPVMERGHSKLSNWRVTKAQDDDGFYIRATGEDGADYPVAVTRHGDEKANAETIVRALNSNSDFIAACDAAMDCVARVRCAYPEKMDKAAYDRAVKAETLIRTAMEKAGAWV